MIKVHLVIKLHKQVIRKNVERLSKRGYEIGLWKLHTVNQQILAAIKFGISQIK